MNAILHGLVWLICAAAGFVVTGLIFDIIFEWPYNEIENLIRLIGIIGIPLYCGWLGRKLLSDKIDKFWPPDPQIPG